MKVVRNRETGEEIQLRCGTCQWFNPLNGSQKGQCRVNPPTPVFIGMQQGLVPGQQSPLLIPVVPTTDALEDWCGQWAPGQPYPTHTDVAPPNETKPRITLP